MAKSPGDSKLAVAGALTLVLAIAGVLLVKEPLRSSRPVGTGLEMKQSTGEQLVRARLWEDPVAAVERAIREKGTPQAASGKTSSLAQRLSTLREAIAERVAGGQRLAVLLTTTGGGPYVESAETRLRDRYAIGTALGAACYVPEDETHLSFVDWDPQGAVRGLPYEWYRLRKTRNCGEPGLRADSVLVVWLPDETLSRGFLATLTSLSQGLACQEASRGECLFTDDKRKLVRLNPAIQQAVTFKIIGPRSSSAYRTLLDEAAALYGNPHDGLGVWPNADGSIELYSPWASAMKGLLAYGLKAESGKGAACATYDDCEHEFYRRLADANIRLVYDIGSDDRQFESLIAELDRRQVRLGWDAVILIGEWDSFYGRALPIEFRAAACAKVATFSEEDLKQIQVPVDIKRLCPSIPQAVDLQIQRPADYEALTLNVFRYSYLAGLDGEVPGDDAARAARAKATAANQAGDTWRDRPEGTSQLDYVRALVARIHDEGEGARAIGIMGTDPYDALLIIKALRPFFPHAIFFTLDLDARHLHPSEYKSTRNMVIASPFGLQLEGGLQRDVPPFRSSYQTSAYFATLQAVGQVTCELKGHQPQRGPCTSAYHAALTPDDRLYDAGSHPRIFEVGRNGAVDLSVVDREGLRTVHPLRSDLAHTEQYGQLKQGVGFDNTVIGASLVIVLLAGTIVAWSNQRIWLWVTRNPKLLAVLGILILAAFAVFLASGGATRLLAGHDEGEPFSWTDGISIWPSELLRFLVVILCLILLAKGMRDLAKNSDLIGQDFLFHDESAGKRFSPGTFWTNLKRVSHPAATMTATTVDQAWSWYREAGKPAQRAARTLLLFFLYLAVMWPLGHWVLDEEMIHPCRGHLSCTVDWVLTLVSVVLVVLLNLAVFDAVMLCRRWIGWVTASTGGWSDRVQEEYLRDYGLGEAQKAEFEKLKYLAVVDLIGQRTEVVNRLIRYPFIALLIMIAGRNDYFDIWNYPILLLFSWALNILLALLAALLLYQAASKAKAAMLTGLSRQMVQALGVGQDRDVRMKQVQFIIDEVEANEQGAFVPLYQQPVVESSLYGLVALLQYLYMK
ncbi:hypothetical protein [Nitrospira lenta]|uniref:Uncharacterized protein n=1 Tax=Nitrospira lenta TaxID=1436998 RepID=A0A330L4F5_9BACT|nr:hypothetical protein [Nitrospira lenta]SPP64557.1 conserved membrane hypothetical protein [Nitrospira lenta]